MINKIKQFTPSENLVIRNVKYSERELVNTMEIIAREQTDLQEQDINIVSIEVDVFNNSVNIGLENFTKEKEVFLKEKYGYEKVKILFNNGRTITERTESHLYMVGGLTIADTASDSTYPRNRCTLGASATKNGVKYFLTAGHCLESYSGYIYQGGDSIGTEHHWVWGDYADVGLIAASNKGISNGMYKYSFDDAAITSYQNSYSNINVGDKVCMSGARTNFQCGQVSAKWASGAGQNGTVLTGYIKTSDIDSAGGDSGAPYWYNGILIGIHHGGETSGTPFTKFTHISKAIEYGGGFTPYTSGMIAY